MKHEAKFSVILPAGGCSETQLETFEKNAPRYGLTVTQPLVRDDAGNVIVSSGLSLRDAQMLRRRVACCGFPADVVSDSAEATTGNDITEITTLMGGKSPVKRAGTSTETPTMTNMSPDALDGLAMPSSLDLGLSDGDLFSVSTEEKKDWSGEDWLNPDTTLSGRTMSISAVDLLNAASGTGSFFGDVSSQNETEDTSHLKLDPKKLKSDLSGEHSFSLSERSVSTSSLKSIGKTQTTEVVASEIGRSASTAGLKPISGVKPSEPKIPSLNKGASSIGMKPSAPKLAEPVMPNNRGGGRVFMKPTNSPKSSDVLAVVDRELDVKEDENVPKNGSTISISMAQLDPFALLGASVIDPLAPAAEKPAVVSTSLPKIPSLKGTKDVITADMPASLIDTKDVNTAEMEVVTDSKDEITAEGKETIKKPGKPVLEPPVPLKKQGSSFNELFGETLNKVADSEVTETIAADLQEVLLQAEDAELNEAFGTAGSDRAVSQAINSIHSQDVDKDSATKLKAVKVGSGIDDDASKTGVIQGELLTELFNEKIEHSGPIKIISPAPNTVNNDAGTDNKEDSSSEKVTVKATDTVGAILDVPDVITEDSEIKSEVLVDKSAPETSNAESSKEQDAAEVSPNEKETCKVLDAVNETKSAEDSGEKNETRNDDLKTVKNADVISESDIVCKNSSEKDSEKPAVETGGEKGVPAKKGKGKMIIIVVLLIIAIAAILGVVLMKS